MKQDRWKSIIEWLQKLWHPRKEEMDQELLNAAYKDCAQTVRRAMLTLLGLCLFTVVTVVGTPDSALVVGDAKITVPFANAKMVVGGFLFAISLILIVVLSYLHVFLGHLKRLERTKDVANDNVGPTIQVPMLFTLDGKMPRAMSYLTFYWSVPLTLAVIVVKGMLPFPTINIVGIGLFAAVTATMILLAVIRDRSHGRFIRNFCHGAVMASIIAFTVHAFLGPDYYHRTLSLERTDLSGKILSRVYLRDADLSGANLNGADLSGADLLGADLPGADLTGANLYEANLFRANLMRADLSGADLTLANLNTALLVKADLSGVDLTGANLSIANLFGANLFGAKLLGADLRGAYLTRANLNGTHLSAASLSGADLTGADLTGADLRGTNLNGADLSGADLNGVQGLTEEQIIQACGDSKTLLPDHLLSHRMLPCPEPD